MTKLEQSLQFQDFRKKMSLKMEWHSIKISQKSRFSLLIKKATRLPAFPGIKVKAYEKSRRDSIAWFVLEHVFLKQ